MAEEGKALKIGVPRERFPGDRRVALIPANIAAFKKAGLEVLVEAGAGTEAGFPDQVYKEKGASLIPDRAGLFSEADIILQVRGPGSNLENGAEDIKLMHHGQALLAMFNPLGQPQVMQQLAEAGVTAFSMELMPRITRAQSMDVLSSMATIGGYKAVLLAAATLPRMFPMFMTAAGTVAPARVLVVGAGVAGLQAIATAKRLGAVVQGYDIRPAVREQVESLGAKFVRLELDAGASEDKGGYAKAMDEEFYRKQRVLMGHVVANNDVVITTAAVPGKKAPVLITDEMVSGMAPGSVVVDLAAEQGGNCSLTKPGETVEAHGVTILGPINLPASVPYHASQMYAKNIQTFLLHLIKDKQLTIDLEDEITSETLLTKDGAVVHAKVKELLNTSA
jgi:NAD(P) transhydrogenase subunit alpha